MEVAGDYVLFFTIDVDECATGICQNGGCVNTNGGYQCLCYNGYEGVNCEIGEKPCSHPLNFLLIDLILALLQTQPLCGTNMCCNL